MFTSLSKNKGIFDYGFSTTYVGEDPFTFEHYLFIGRDFWKVEQREDHEREVCIEDLESQQHSEFDHKFCLGFSYLSDHMVEHDDELNLTNHVFIRKFTTLFIFSLLLPKVITKITLTTKSLLMNRIDTKIE
jgi:hypothetical protein